MKYLILLLTLTSCSAAFHLQQAKKHLLIAESKGAKISKDTVHVIKTIYVSVPAKKDSLNLIPEIDIKSFDDTMGLNDSLVIAIHETTEEINKGTTINMEKSLIALKRANAEIKALKKRIAKGFMKDSTYHFEPDSLTKIDVTVRADQSISVKHARKEYKISHNVDLPVSIDQTIKAGYTKWNLAGIAIFSAVLFFLFGYLFRSLKK